MCSEAVKIEAGATHGNFPPVVPTVCNLVFKSTVKNERPVLAWIMRPIRGFKRLLPGLLRFGPAILIDQRVHERNGVRHREGHAECALAIPDCKRRIR